VRLALAFAAGTAWGLVGAPLVLAPLAGLVYAAWPDSPSRRPVSRVACLVAAACGLSAALGAGRPGRCARHTSSGPERLEGRFLTSPVGGTGTFRVGSGCGDVTVVVPGALITVSGSPDAGASPSADGAVPVARAMRLEGTWRAGRARPYFVASRLETLGNDSRSRGWSSAEWRWWPIRWREGLLGRYRRLYGPRAPLVAALTLARREGLDPEVTESFARVGIAHLLAISGFHVGVIASAALGILGLLGIDRGRRELAATGATWAYVALIGFPDAACRAALMLALVAIARARGRTGARTGPLGAALLILLTLDARRAASVGFQLSFAGAAGLVGWAGGLSASIRRACRGRCPAPLGTALAAGLAATAATLPVVAWHFERVSLIGVPATLLATPWVALALSGALASLVLDFVWPQAAAWLAGGVSTLLAGLEWAAGMASSWTWASVWTTRGSVIAGVLGVALALHVARRPGVGAAARRGLSVLYVVCGVLAWPVVLTWERRGSVEIVAIDVGQGDAIALRSPRGRWVLVDAGPPGRSPDPGGHAVVRALRARGVRRIEALVLTHPDLDHIGGAGAVLSALEVGAVYDPALPAPKESFVAVLDAASSRGVPWRSARAGQVLELDGLRLDVLHPPVGAVRDLETNATSVVLRASFGDFDALLTGDVSKDVERSLSERLPSIEVLKVAHHGSDTSTDSLLLAATRPALALISVGRSNRYGHPSPAVLGRLRRGGAEIRRTDREGTLSVWARRDGSFSVSGTHMTPAVGWP